MRIPLAFVLTFLVLAFTARALGFSWAWSLGWGAAFGAVAGLALLAAKKGVGRSGNPIPWMLAAAAVSILPAVVALVRGSFEKSLLLNAVTAALFLAAAAVIRRERQPR